MYMSDYLEMTILYLEQHRISAGEGLDEGEEVEVSHFFFNICMYVYEYMSAHQLTVILMLIVYICVCMYQL